MEKNPMLSLEEDLIFDTENRINRKIPIKVEMEIEQIVAKEHENIEKNEGYCHLFWARKKELLKEKGYNWLSPFDQGKHIVN